MNRVGEEGKGESVWLGWFLAKTLQDFPPFAKAADDKRARRRAGRSMPKTLKKALEAAGWDGEWYRRGSYDDGTPLGSRAVRTSARSTRSRSRGACCPARVARSAR